MCRLPILPKTYPPYERHGWLFYAGIRVGADYFYHPVLRVVVDMDIRQDDVLDTLYRYLDRDPANSQAMVPEGWELWVCEVASKDSVNSVTSFEQRWIHHALRSVSDRSPGLDVHTRHRVENNMCTGGI